MEDGKPRNRKESVKQARKRAKVAREDDLIAQHHRKRETKCELKASLTKIGKYETTECTGPSHDLLSYKNLNVHS
jgi:hypothetical protein